MLLPAMRRRDAVIFQLHAADVTLIICFSSDVYYTPHVARAPDVAEQRVARRRACGRDAHVLCCLFMLRTRELRVDTRERRTRATSAPDAACRARYV